MRSAAAREVERNATLPPGERSQQIAARVAGFLYLFINATGIFGYSIRGRLIVRGDAAQTAKNIVASERLFRIGIASDLITVAGVIILVWALYVVLKPINRNGALLAVFLRLVENTILAVTTVNLLAALVFLSGADYLRAFDAQQLQALAYASLRLYGALYEVGFVFLGLGSTVFGYLWFKSRYIPRALAALGIFGSLLFAIATLAIIIFPGWAAVVVPAYWVPMGVFEITLGLWLLVKGIQAPVRQLAA